MLSKFCAFSNLFSIPFILTSCHVSPFLFLAIIVVILISFLFIVAIVVILISFLFIVAIVAILISFLFMARFVLLFYFLLIIIIFYIFHFKFNYFLWFFQGSHELAWFLIPNNIKKSQNCFKKVIQRF